MRETSTETGYGGDKTGLKVALSSTTALTGTGFGSILAGAVVVAALASGAARAEDFWTGAVSGDWFTAGNWADNSVPTAADPVVLDTTTPNLTRIGPGVANSMALFVGTATGDGGLLIHSGGDLINGVGVIGTYGSGGVTVMGPGSTWTNSTLRIGDPEQGVLAIAGGGVVSSVDTYLGHSGPGDAAVMGAGSLWSITGDFFVGYNGNGELRIADGGAVTSVDSTLGQNDGSFGAVTVTGAGSTWTNSGYLEIGEHGTGTLTIEAGGNVTTDRNASVGRDSGGVGTVTVTGPGSTWTTNGFLKVGDLTGSQGTLTIADQGTVISNSQVRLANAPGTQGTVLVTGAGSKWIGPPSQFHVGFWDKGTLTIADGGEVQTGFTTLGTWGGSTGTATVTGGGSVWNISDDFEVGVWGAGLLTIGNGGAVNSIDSTIGVETDGIGEVTVTGPGSSWSNTGTLFIGNEGAGAVTIADGATANSGGVYLARTADSTGSTTVTGSGSTWNTGFFGIGENGQGTLTIANGGAVHSGHGDIGLYDGTGFATVTGAGSTWTTSYLTVGEYGVGTLLIEDGGVVTNTTDAFIGYEATSIGGVTVTGVGSEWTNGGAVEVGFRGTGTLTVENGGIVSGTFGYVGSLAGSQGTATVTGANSQWISSGTMAVGHTGVGFLAVEAGGTVENTSAYIGYNAAGTVRVAGPDSIWKNSGRVTIGRGGTGVLTVADHGTVLGTDAVLGAFAGSQGTVNIGAAAGDAPVAPGTLEIAQLNFGSGNGSLVFNHTSGNYLFAPDIVGAGQIDLLSGTTELDSVSGFSGTTSVDSGATLVINNDLGSSLGATLDVLAGGLLKGSGTVGPTTVAGTVAPGNSIGTLHIVGPYTQAAGSVYEVEIDAAGNSDLIDVVGTATLNGGTVQVVPLPDFALATPYTILTATGGVTGTFAGASMGFSSAFLSPQLAYGTNDVTFTIAQTADFVDAALTPNQRAAATGADSLGAGSPVWDAIALLSSASDAPAAFDALSGEVHASAQSVLIGDSRFVREAMGARLRTAFAGVGAEAVPALAYGDDGRAVAPADADRFAVWGHAFGSWGEWDSDGNAASLSRDTGGFFLGGDMAVAEVWRLGLLAGYSSSSFDIDDRASSGSADSYHLGAYAGTEIGALGLRFGGAWSRHEIETTRMAAFPGFADTLSAGYDADTAQIFAEAGYRIDTARASFEPFANLAYVNLGTDGFTETGGPAALTAASADQDTTFTTLGLRAETVLPFGDTTARLHGVLGWRHAFGDIVPATDLAFAGGSIFTIAGVPIAEDAAIIKAGFDVALGRNASLGIAYNGQIGSGISDHGLKARFGLSF